MRKLSHNDHNSKLNIESEKRKMRDVDEEGEEGGEINTSLKVEFDVYFWHFYNKFHSTELGMYHLAGSGVTFPLIHIAIFLIV